jgi:hypothetical protein
MFYSKFMDSYAILAAISEFFAWLNYKCSLNYLLIPSETRSCYLAY